MLDIHQQKPFLRGYPTTISYEKILTSYLGDDYELSLVFCSKKTMKRLNNQTRQKNYATNILSFPLSETVGEMFICLPVCRGQYKKFDRDFNNFIAFLYVHGLVHLKGYDHGAIMDQQEESLRKQFGI